MVGQSTVMAASRQARGRAQLGCLSMSLQAALPALYTHQAQCVNLSAQINDYITQCHGCLLQ